MLYLAWKYGKDRKNKTKDKANKREKKKPSVYCCKTEIKFSLSDRPIACSVCGFIEDRNINTCRNMLSISIVFGEVQEAWLWLTKQKTKLIERLFSTVRDKHILWHAGYSIPYRWTDGKLCSEKGKLLTVSEERRSQILEEKKNLIFNIIH